MAESTINQEWQPISLGSHNLPITINVPSNSTHIIITARGAGANRRCAYIVTCNSSGAVSAFQLAKDSDISVATATNKVTISTSASGSGSVSVYDLVLAGSRASIPA